MDYETVKQAYESGYLNKEHLDWIFNDRSELIRKITEARVVLLQVRDDTYRGTDKAKNLIDETVERLMEHKNV